jgi:hypothetical protein
MAPAATITERAAGAILLRCGIVSPDLAALRHR